MNSALSDKVYVISNFNFNYSYLIKDLNSYVIYDQSSVGKLPEFSSNVKYIESPHSGHNITDILDFIIENYSHLPQLTFFLKGNVVPKFIKFDRLEYFMGLNNFSSIFETKRTLKNLKWYKKNKHLIKEKNNSWYLDFKPSIYFKSYNDFLGQFFKIVHFPRYVLFSPGASLCVERERIHFYPKEFYEKLQTLIKGEFFPGEAYLLERVMYFMFEKKREINYEILDFDFIKVQKEL